MYSGCRRTSEGVPASGCHPAPPIWRSAGRDKYSAPVEITAQPSSHCLSICLVVWLSVLKYFVTCKFSTYLHLIRRLQVALIYIAALLTWRTYIAGVLTVPAMVPPSGGVSEHGALLSGHTLLSVAVFCLLAPVQRSASEDGWGRRTADLWPAAGAGRGSARRTDSDTMGLFPSLL